MAAVFCYITVENREQALSIGRTVVEEQLAACANVLPGMTSIYRWQDKVEQADEVVLILKTAVDRFDELTRRVRELHPYDCPCIIGLPIQLGDRDYLAWLVEQTRP